MRVLVCGGRYYSDRAHVFYVLDQLDMRRISMVIHGGAGGADELAGIWAKDRIVPCEVYKAEWAILGNRAGPARNQRMLDKGKPDLVVAFPGGTGTADMVRRARLCGVPVQEAGKP